MTLDFPNPRAFTLHYNKPASAQAREPRISVHVAGACHIVSNVICSVPTWGRIRKTQPRWVLAGKARRFHICPAGTLRIS